MKKVSKILQKCWLCLRYCICFIVQSWRAFQILKILELLFLSFAYQELSQKKFDVVFAPQFLVPSQYVLYISPFSIGGTAFNTSSNQQRSNLPSMQFYLDHLCNLSGTLIQISISNNFLIMSIYSRGPPLSLRLQEIAV